MAGLASEIRLGACWVTFAGTDLGYTKGGVVLSLETMTQELIVDQAGQMPLAEIIMGRRCTVMVPLAQTNASVLSKLIPGNTSIGSIYSGVGLDLFDYTGQLVLTAKKNPGDTVTIYKAAPITNMQAVFLPNSERIWPVQFKGYVSAGDGAILGITVAS